ncbi:422_t:CDS:10 [Diversispora eburnea]|uniref:non-specific serine/threonine protein kinase n=1 Tax=Diversispora eburnea TaxID=1213867 RepID=A0A9N8ZU47_9GLOM|nr:422_t:CDS:10 [Diversispora eburnea]
MHHVQGKNNFSRLADISEMNMNSTKDENNVNNANNTNNTNNTNNIYKIVKPLTSEKLKKFEKEQNKTGLVYLSRIPPFMKPSKIKHLLSRYGDIGRAYLVPEGGKKRNYYYDDLWNIKYLPKFKWNHLTEQIAYENVMRTKRLQVEISQGHRENKEYIKKVEKAKMFQNIESKKQRKTTENDDAQDITFVEVNYWAPALDSKARRRMTESEERTANKELNTIINLEKPKRNNSLPVIDSTDPNQTPFVSKTISNRVSNHRQSNGQSNGNINGSNGIAVNGSSEPKRMTIVKSLKNLLNAEHKSVDPESMFIKKYGVCEKGVIGKGATAVVRLAHKNEQTNIEQTFAVKEYCPGGDLYAAIKAGYMTSVEINCCFKQLIMGVGYLHSMGVAHRDIKPENLLLNESGHLKITDFGVSDVFKTVWEGSAHLSKGLCGSEPYIAPEQFETKEYDARLVDVWACGIVYYCMIYQGIPFRMAASTDPNYANYVNYLETKNSGLYEPFEKLPRGCRDLLYKILQPDPKKRYNIEKIKKDPWFKEIECLVMEEKLTETEQRAISNLRQRSLLFWLDMCQNKPKMIVKLYENTVIQGKFNSVDTSENKFRFDKWKSPVGIYDHVVIRGTDIKALEFDYRLYENAK